MNAKEWIGQISEAELQDLLQEHYVPLAIPEEFKRSLFADLEREYGRFRGKAVTATAWRRVLPRFRLRAIAASAFAALVLGLVGIVLLSAPGNVLAQTAKALKSVSTFHYEVRVPGVPSQGIREIWTRKSQMYCRLRQNGAVAAELWMDQNRCVRYYRQSNEVVVSDPSSELVAAVRSIDVIREFKPDDWQHWPEHRVREGGRRYQVFHMPGTGRFRGLGQGGDTRMKLWVDEATYLPAKLWVELKPADQAEWKPFLQIDFLWDEPEVPVDFFKPKYPATATVREAERRPAAPASEPMAEPIATASKNGRVGLTLEKLWIHPAGLVVLRVNLHDRVPFGRPPDLSDPAENPWGLRPEELTAAVQGQLLLDPSCKTRRLGVGGVPDRWAAYMVYAFEKGAGALLPGKLTLRYLLARPRLESDESHEGYVQAVLEAPSSWQLFEFAVATAPYVVEQIPEEIYGSPNLHAEKILIPVLSRIVRSYEAEGGEEKALAFIQAQGPITQDLLGQERNRLEGNP